MDSQRLVNVNGYKIVVSVTSTGSKGRVNLGGLCEEALNSADVRLALLCAEIGPARGGYKLRIWPCGRVVFNIPVLSDAGRKQITTALGRLSCVEVLNSLLVKLVDEVIRGFRICTGRHSVGQEANGGGDNSSETHGV